MTEPVVYPQALSPVSVRRRRGGREPRGDAR